MPDEANIGLEEISTLLVTHIENKKIINLKDLYDKITEALKNKKEFLEIRLFGGYIVYLDLKKSRRN